MSKEYSLTLSLLPHCVPQIPDHALPDLIGRAIMHNANAVIELQAVLDKLQRVEGEHATLSAEYAAVSRMQVCAHCLIAIY
jgi:uncharacterized protein YbjQ (UPF0145 family)